MLMKSRGLRVVSWSSPRGLVDSRFGARSSDGWG